ncbi:hypothetical protein SK3146_00998 [Paenibacillus konkukensis]|uniref:Uncharacterized protein n=1 Tax=Paenibacillus konkukensis TaxID=2020716 RepID=A0ABY4RI45_9BACL|nr:hypothetical protein [Paenibacillus konkukensis]UQZ81842.1 hypothetical protein SK3146_00998 [Paenibacillus konkukensis]
MKKSPYLYVGILNLLAAVAFVVAGFITTSNTVKYGYIGVAVLFAISALLNFKRNRSEK